MENVIVKMDVRGFIRFPEEAVKALKLDKLATQTKTEDGRTVDVGPYVDVEVDPAGKRIAITPIKTPKSTSFRFINGISSVFQKKIGSRCAGISLLTNFSISSLTFFSNFSRSAKNTTRTRPAPSIPNKQSV